MENKEQEVIIKAYELAKEKYKKWGIDTDSAIERLSKIPVSMHCWQGDDVKGFENEDGELTGGIQATGNYPGGARNAKELREDLDKALTLIPGTHRLNLHAIYAETNGEKVERDQLKPEHFKNWVKWARSKGIGLDFNPTCFSHELSADGFTLSSENKEKREFWIRHCKASRKIGEYFGMELGTPCVTNVWIPDGYKDIPADRYSPRKRLKEALDEVFSEVIDPKYNLDAVECKLFGIGSESYVTGSHEFYMGYAIKNNKLLTLDAGHFHPTEVISDKISSILNFTEEVLLHVSRPVRWDSDHVVLLNDELQSIADEIISGGFENRVHIGLDYFDASINRIAAWVIGMRNMQKALLTALLKPMEFIKKAELEGDYTSRLVLMEEFRSYPVSAVWEYYCLKAGVPVGEEWLDMVKEYEKEVLLVRK